MSIKYKNAAIKYAAPQDKRCMRLNDLVSYTSMSKSYITRLVKDGKFPAGINIGANLSNSGKLVVWEKVAVDQWLDKQMGGK
jgi:predicted DNA-binding transcriptional regulator AlpA